MESKYRNATWVDKIVNGLTGTTAAEEDKARLALLTQISNKPASSNTLLILIPVIGIIIGVIAIVVLKRKK